MKVYTINGSITISPSRNLVNDVKLEPRIMKLLCLLVENAGKTVTREDIIQQIWDGYGGGDDGLTQATSFLRKILNDTNKTMIETIPKVGYVFNGIVQESGSIEPSLMPQQTRTKRKRKSLAVLLLLAAIFIILAIVIFSSKQSSRIAPKAPAENKLSLPSTAPKAIFRATSPSKQRI